MILGVCEAENIPKYSTNISCNKEYISIKIYKCKVIKIYICCQCKTLKMNSRLVLLTLLFTLYTAASSTIKKSNIFLTVSRDATDWHDLTSNIHT